MSSSLPTVRRAVPSDARGLSEADARAWRETYDGLLPDRFLATRDPASREGVWTSVLGARDGRLAVHVAVDRGRIVGFVQHGMCWDLGTEQDAEISMLYLLASHQGRGLGRALVGEAARNLSGRGFGSLRIWVLSKNVKARRFYEQLGGVPVGSRPTRAGGARVVETAYAWPDLRVLFDTRVH